MVSESVGPRIVAPRLPRIGWGSASEGPHIGSFGRRLMYGTVCVEAGAELVPLAVVESVDALAEAAEELTITPDALIDALEAAGETVGAAETALERRSARAHDAREYILLKTWKAQKLGTWLLFIHQIPAPFYTLKKLVRSI